MIDEPGYKVILEVKDDDGIAVTWVIDLLTTVDNATAAIDVALRECDMEIIGLKNVERYTITNE